MGRGEVEGAHTRTLQIYRSPPLPRPPNGFSGRIYVICFHFEQGMNFVSRRLQWLANELDMNGFRPV